MRCDIRSYRTLDWTIPLNRNMNNNMSAVNGMNQYINGDANKNVNSYTENGNAYIIKIQNKNTEISQINNSLFSRV